MNPKVLGIKTAWIVTGMLLGCLGPLSAQTQNWTKTFLRGVYNGKSSSYQDPLNHKAPHLDFMMGYGFLGGQDSFYTNYCSSESQAAVAVNSYSIYDERISLPDSISLSSWKNSIVGDFLDVVSGSYTNTNYHYIGEEAPEYYDKVYFDTENFVVNKEHTKWGSNDVIYTAGNVGADRPDVFLWVKGVCIHWVYPYPFNTSFGSGTPYEEYQEILQKGVVDPINYDAGKIKMYRRWGVCPDLQMASCPQTYFEAKLGGISGTHHRRPTRGELLLQNWITVMRGGKGIAPFTYQCMTWCDGSSIWIGLIDNQNSEPFEEDITNEVYLTDKVGGNCVVSGTYIAEEGHQSNFDGDAMFTWQVDFFGQIETIDTALRNQYQYSNGLYEVDVDTFRSVRSDMSAPLYFVRQITVTPPSSYTKNHMYTERLTAYHSLGGQGQHQPEVLVGSILRQIHRCRLQSIEKDGDAEVINRKEQLLPFLLLERLMIV